MTHIFRSQELTDKYTARHKSPAFTAFCPLCEAAVIELFSYWKVITNNYPHDLITKIYHMLVPTPHHGNRSHTRRVG